MVGLRNYAGAVLANYTYDSWGKLVSITDGNGTPLADGSFAHQMAIRYRGYYYDTETGLYYLQSRYYDPETGRFLNVDDVNYIGVQNTNLSYNAFTYCDNNAINYYDFMGKAKSKNNNRNTKKYVYVYYYSVEGEGVVAKLFGHLDFSLMNETLYSYGTFDGEKKATTKEKISGNAKGYLCIDTANNWHKLNKKTMPIKKKIKLGLTNEEYDSLGFLLALFMNCLKPDNKKGKSTQYREVKSGQYKFYNFTKANCATFVRDMVMNCASDLFGSKVTSSIYCTPSIVCSEIQKKGTLIE